MFDDYAKKLEAIEANTPKIFEKVAKKGAIKFVKEAKERTDKEGLVDTGNYKRSWQAEAFEPKKGVHGVICENTADYATELEYGHRTRNGGITKGRFVGRISMDEARYYCMQKLHEEFEKAFKKYHYSFTKK